MKRTTISGLTVEYNYRDTDQDLHELDRDMIASAIRQGFYSGWLSVAFQSPGSWCVVR